MWKDTQMCPRIEWPGENPHLSWVQNLLDTFVTQKPSEPVLLGFYGDILELRLCYAGIYGVFVTWVMIESLATGDPFNLSLSLPGSGGTRRHKC